MSRPDAARERGVSGFPSLDHELVAQRLMSLPFAVFAGAAFALALLRNGLYLAWSKGIWVAAASAFPARPSLITESWGFLLVPHLLHLSTVGRWTLYYCLLTVVFMAGVLLAARQLDAVSSRLWVLGVTAWSGTTALLFNIGWYDVITLIGALCIATTRSLWLTLAGAVVMSSGNPSESLLAAVSFLFVAFGMRSRDMLRKAALTLAVTAADYAAVTVWLHGLGVAGRAGEFSGHLVESIRSFLAAAPLAVVSWYGAAWLLVAAILWSTSGRRALVLCTIGLVLIPAAASMTTLDQMRVFVGVSALPALAALWSRLRSGATSAHWLVAMAVSALLTPALYFRGDTQSVWLPYWWLISEHRLT